MKGLRRAPAGALVAAIGVGLAAMTLHARETTRPAPSFTGRFLYLQSGAVARRLFLCFDAIAADVYWIRTIQHYGRDLNSTRTTDRFQLLQPLLDLTTTLDPHFNLAYRFGAIFLSIEQPKGPGRPDQAIALLEKGLVFNPGRWQYAHDIGLIHYLQTGNFVEAARWFDIAASMPGAPVWIRPLAAVTRAQGGDRQGARQLFDELLTSDQPFLRQWAERGLLQVRALDEIDALQGAIEAFHRMTGRYPDNWKDLIAAHILTRPPTDPTGALYVYDPATHTASLAPLSNLALPRALPRR